MSAVTVQSLSPTTAALALAAGFLSFASPCVLPLVPVYLSYISGVSVDRLADERDRVLGVALAFVAGFTVVFMAFGAAAGSIGAALLNHRAALTILAGIFLIVSGLVMAGALRPRGLHLGATPRAGGLGRAFITGAAVSIGWTPCVGYVLGGILTLAGSRQSAGAGALLLLLYSIGLGLPFVLMALAFGWATRRLSALRRHYRAVQLVAGGLLAAFGILLLVGGSEQLNRWLPHVSFFGL